jgi:hypothetical protein
MKCERKSECALNKILSLNNERTGLETLPFLGRRLRSVASSRRHHFSIRTHFVFLSTLRNKDHPPNEGQWLMFNYVML